MDSVHDPVSRVALTKKQSSIFLPSVLLCFFFALAWSLFHGVVVANRQAKAVECTGTIMGEFGWNGDARREARGSSGEEGKEAHCWPQEWTLKHRELLAVDQKKKMKD